VLFDPATGERSSLTTVEGISALAWSTDGTAIAIVSPSSGVSIIDLATGRSTSIARLGTIEVHGLSWSPDGKRFVLESHGSIIVVNADGSDRRVLVTTAATIQRGLRTGRGSPTFERRARPARSLSRCG
jgi:Tol biopolymer transport system component